MIAARWRVFGALLLAALLTGGLAVPASAVEDETSAGFETVLRGTNDYRQLSGVERLVHDPRISAVAQAWAERMAADYAATGDLSSSFRHNPNLSSQVPSGWEALGENIAWNRGYPQPYDMLLEQWRTSPGHNANMLNSRWTHIGIGTYQDAQGGTWGVQVFGDYGSPASTPDPRHAVVDLDSIGYSGTVACVVLVSEPSGLEFFRQCGSRPGNVYTFSDVPPGTYSATLLDSGGGVLYSGWLIDGGTLTAHVTLDGGGSAGEGCVGVYTVDYSDGNTACGTDDISVVGLPTGDYVVQFLGFDTAAAEWYEDAADRSGATLVSIVAGEVTEVSGSLAPYAAPTGVSPGFGPSSGETTVTISGSHFTGATLVTFDGAAGTSLSVDSDTQITVTTPDGTALRAPVLVTTPNGVSPAPPNVFFAYTDGSVVAGIPEVIADVSSFTAGVVRCYQVTGRAGVPVGAVGVVLNVTASLPNGVGHVRVYPDYLNNGASPAPLVSTVNFEVGRDVANSTTISLPSGGKVCAYGVGGTLSRLILDVDGYILPGSGITLITPEKLVDTRSQAWYHVGDITGPVQPMTDYEVQVGGVGSVPTDAEAVMVNITVVDTRSSGHLRMWASDQAMPDTSVVNYAPETKANSQIVALSADGKLTFRSFSYVPTSVSPVQVLIDVTGYIAAGSDFVATVPTKLVETRSAYGIVGPIPGSLNPNRIYPVPVDTSVVPAGATAVVLNVTAVQPTNFGHIRVYPDTNGLGTTPPPVMSNLNFIPGRDIPNMVIVQLPANRTIDLYTAYAGTGRTDLVVNIIGYIAGTT